MHHLDSFQNLNQNRHNDIERDFLPTRGNDLDTRICGLGLSRPLKVKRTHHSLHLEMGFEDYRFDPTNLV